MRIAVALLTAAAVVSGTGMAQETAPPFPLVNDLPEGWEFAGQPAPVDVLGIKIGMPREAAEAAALAGMEAEASSGTVRAEEIGIAGDGGIQVMFYYPTGYWIDLTTPDGDQSLRVKYTTGVSGERVALVERSVSWTNTPADQRPRVSSVVASLTEKYGEPSFAPGPKPYDTSITMLWGYHKGQKLSLPADTVPYDIVADSPEGCLKDVYIGQYTGYGSNSPETQERLKDCSLIVSVNIQMHNGVQGTVYAMQLRMGGSSRWMENSKATDAFLEAELEKALAAPPAGGPAPKL